MKLRNIFTALASAFVLTFVGCQEPERFLDEVKVSQSTVAIAAAGETVEVDVDASGDWNIVAVDAKTSANIEIPEWLAISPMSGSKGKSVVKFTAEAATETREVRLHLNCGEVYQIINVIQMTQKAEAPLTKLSAILSGGEIGAFYRVKGVVAEVPVADFKKYGKFFIIDDSVDKKVEIYGLANKTSYLDKAENPTIEAGDIVTIEGSWSKYGNFNNDTKILEVEKSLIKVEKVSPATALAKEGDVFTVTLTNKGEGLEISIPEADTTWIKAAEPFVAGTTMVVEFTVAANESTPRSTTITFSTTSGDVTYQATAAIEQNGGVPQMTIAQAVASGELGMVIGKVLYVHSKGVLITDGTDVLYGYIGSQLEVAVGDVVSMIGTVTLYNGGRSMNKPTVAPATATVAAYTAPAPIVLDAAKFAELTDKSADFATPYVSITGVAETDNYNNIIVKLADGETTYSVKSYYGVDSYADWAGQTVEVRGYAYNAYNDSKQVNLIVTSVQEPLLTLPAIAEVRAAAKGDAVITEGTVMAIHKKGYIISDATGSIYVYTNAAPDVAVGNKVKVSGVFDNYYGTLQIKNPVVEANDNATSVTYPTPIDLTDPATYEAFATYSAANPTDFAYVKIKGVLSGDYSSIVTVGSSTKTAQFDYSSGDYSALNGKTVVVKAYMKGFHSKGYYQLMETSVVEEGAEPEEPAVLTLTNAEILAAIAEANTTETSYVTYDIPSASGTWNVNAQRHKDNPYLQCRGRKGSYIKTPVFDKDIKSVTIHFSDKKSVYADNVYCAFPATWTAPTADEAYSDGGNVGKAVTVADSHTLTIPVSAGNRQVCISIIGTYSYYLDHIDVEF